MIIMQLTPIKKRYVKSNHPGLSKLCHLIILEIPERAEKFGFLDASF